MQKDKCIIKCEAIEQFTLNEFDKLSDIKRKSISKEKTLFVGDIFKCDENMAKYLLGSNEKLKKVIRILEVDIKSEK